MITELSGRITFDNGRAAPGVQVRIFDEDAPGKGDDDLTIEPGFTDARGSFTVRYDPGRYVDFARLPLFGLRVPDLLDILAPYLQLTYTFDGEQRVHTAPMRPFQSRYRLPEAPPLDFLPSVHGFVFANNFPALELPITLPGLPGVRRIAGGYGLCGGMSAAACDLYLNGRGIPARGDVPRVREKLHRYLFRRALDSFQMGESVVRFAQWMALDDLGPNGVRRLTLLEWDKLRDALDRQRLVPIGLVIAAGRGLRDISRDVWKNHQVLAYGYREVRDGCYEVRVYDPNAPRSDDVLLRLEQQVVGEADGAPVEGMQVTPVNVRIHPPLVRGFFLMPYEPIDPPEDL
jgi:hypothetical protein